MKKTEGKIIQIAYNKPILIMLDAYGNVYKKYVDSASTLTEEIEVEPRVAS